MKKLTHILLLLISVNCFAQQLNLKKRKSNALSGTEFAKSVSDTSLSLLDREKLIFNEVKSGNVPLFMRQLSVLKVKKIIKGTNYELTIYAVPDYLAIGSNDDFFYIPTIPMLAQQIANLTKTMLPTKLVVDKIYEQAKIKLEPQPIPPTKAMTTLPVFIAHNAIVVKQLELFNELHLKSALTAGNKKDIIISNKIYGQPTPRVVIYGWHKLDGKAIQPVYNKHTNTWADYSHGVRLLSKTALLNGKKVKLEKILKDAVLSQLISDEGVIEKIKYPLN